MLRPSPDVCSRGRLSDALRLLLLGPTAWPQVPACKVQALDCGQAAINCDLEPFQVPEGAAPSLPAHSDPGHTIDIIAGVAHSGLKRLKSSKCISTAWWGHRSAKT